MGRNNNSQISKSLKHSLLLTSALSESQKRLKFGHNLYLCKSYSNGLVKQFQKMEEVTKFEKHNFRKVLLLYTGGTIGMKANESGGELIITLILNKFVINGGPVKRFLSLISVICFRKNCSNKS